MDGWPSPAPLFGRTGGLLALCALFTCMQPVQAQACGPAPAAREATSPQIGAWLHERGLQVLTFVGYSGAGYENPDAMLAAAGQVLDRHDPARTVVNIGATEAGIGAVYALARQRGFRTMGIVSTLAREAGEPLSPCVDQVFFVRATPPARSRRARPRPPLRATARRASPAPLDAKRAAVQI